MSLAHRVRGFHGLDLGSRSDPVLLERTQFAPGSRPAGRAAARPGVPLHRQIEASIRAASGPAGCGWARRCHRRRGRRRPRRVARGGGGGVPAARGGGLPDQPGRRLHRGRDGSAPAPAGRAAAGRAAPDRLRVRPHRRVVVPPGRLAALGAHRADRRRPTSGSRTSTGAACRNCTTPWPTTSTGSAARRRGPANVVICNGYGQGVALLIQVLAARGARRFAVEDPSSDDDARAVAVRRRAGGRRHPGRPGRHPGRRARAGRRRRRRAHAVAPVAHRRRAVGRGPGGGDPLGAEAATPW